jgi:hypothetical protein
LTATTKSSSLLPASPAASAQDAIEWRSAVTPVRSKLSVRRKSVLILRP